MDEVEMMKEGYLASEETARIIRRIIKRHDRHRL